MASFYQLASRISAGKGTFQPPNGKERSISIRVDIHAEVGGGGSGRRFRRHSESDGADRPGGQQSLPVITKRREADKYPRDDKFRRSSETNNGGSCQPPLAAPFRRLRSRDYVSGHMVDNFDPSTSEKNYMSDNCSVPGAYSMPGGVESDQSAATKTISNLDDYEEHEDEPYDEELYGFSIGRKNSGSRLVSASLVDQNMDKDRIINDFIRKATMAYVVEEVKPTRKSRLKLILCSMLGIIIVTTIVVVLVLTLQSNPSREDDYNNRISQEESIFKLLTTISNSGELWEVGSPQNQAFSWLVRDGLDLEDASYKVVKERYIAALFYFSTGGNDHWINDYGFLGNQTSVCTWNDGGVSGIICDKNNLIISISAAGNNLVGTLPYELASLSSLEYVILENNALSGTISTTFGDITRLKNLHLSSNKLTGSIPDEISTLTNLASLSLMDNLLTGTIHGNLMSLTSLEKLNIENNKLSGTIPECEHYSSFKEISLGSNRLKGSIPRSISHLASTLERLQLADNDLDGTIPPNLGSCSRLEILSLHSNSLSGSLPPQLGNAKNLQLINIKSNMLTGAIPSEIGEIKKLLSFDASSNRLSGQIPSELGFSTDLFNLALGYNSLTGTLPEELAFSKKLLYVKVNDNDLTGTIAGEFCSRNDYQHSALEIFADCNKKESDNPKVECDCCFCEGPDEYDFVHNEDDCNDALSGFVLSQFDDSRGAFNCRCLDAEGKGIECTESCLSCNTDKSICVQNLGLELYFDEVGDLLPDIVENNIQYVNGRDKDIKVTWGSSGWRDGTADQCWVKINDESCRSCVINSCSNGENALHISCDNIPVVGANFDGCKTRREDAGVFEAIFWSPKRNLVHEDYCPVLDPINVLDNISF